MKVVDLPQRVQHALGSGLALLALFALVGCVLAAVAFAARLLLGADVTWRLRYSGHLRHRNAAQAPAWRSRGPRRDSNSLAVAWPTAHETDLARAFVRTALDVGVHRRAQS